MAKFCIVRFERDPLGERMLTKTKMTWGDNIRHLYADYWGWGCEVSHMAKRSVAKPVIMEVFYND